MTNFPALLKQRRKDLGISLDKIASQTKVRKTYLKAIENGQFAEIPFSIYTIGYLKNYAKLLHLNSDELVNQFKESLRNVHKTETSLYYNQENLDNLPSFRVIIGSLIASICLYKAIIFKPVNYLDMLPQAPFIEFIDAPISLNYFMQHKWLTSQNLEVVIIAKANMNLSISYPQLDYSKHYFLKKGAIKFIPFNEDMVIKSTISNSFDVLLNEN